ncbi:hypothetical protein SCUCBS95973_002993 [Sporothrix curviconia]|uniref:Aminoglycoside phosphotransferase domain-containing protein n=1 Tax=Sporothrix curviconia TaxID=1260050 RepID=A0ABP0BBM4_9PEZI
MCGPPAARTPQVPYTNPGAFFPAYDAAKKKYLSALLARVDGNALQAVATESRGGIPCTIPALSKDVPDDKCLETVSRQCGGQNAHVDVVFDDGVTWLARLRLDDPLLPPAAVQTCVLESEVATLQFLAKTKVLAPRVFAHVSTAANNPVGTPYILMEKLPGKPLDWSSASPAQRERVLEQMAEIYLELEKHPLPATGCLALSDGNGEDVQVGPFVQPPCFVTPTSALGPFSTLAESYMAIIRHQMAMLATGEYGSLRVDNYLAFLWRAEALPKLVDDDRNSNTGPFYLKHYDDKGDHILVDANYNITGIIDWEWASFETKPYAFSAPCMLWPVGDFYEGSNVLSSEEVRFAELLSIQGRGDLAQLVRTGRPWQRFLFFLGGGLPQSREEFEPLFHGLQKALADDSDDVDEEYAEWKAKRLVKFAMDDPNLADLALQK